jgi:DNA-binding ferritin-like protein
MGEITKVSLSRGILPTVTDQWETRFDNHPLWSTLQTLKGQVDSLDLPIDPTLAAAYNRVLRMIATIESYRDSENSKDLYTNTMLQQVYNAVTQYVSNEISQYAQDPATYPARLTAAAENIDTVFDELAKWPALSTKGRAVAAGQAAAQYADASVDALARFSTEVDEIGERVTALRAQVDTQIDEVQTTRDQTIQQLQEGSNTELASLKSQIADLENEITAHTKRLENFSDSTEDKMNAKVEEFGEWSQEQIEERVGEEIKSVRDRTDSTVAYAKAGFEDVQKLHGETEKLTKQTRNLVQSFAERAVADDYQKNARNKSVAGWFWDILGFIVGAVPLSLVLYHFLAVTEAPQSITSLTLTRVGISAAAVGVAALCFHRGHQNHNESRLAKRTDLRVRTVHQFLANLDPDVQQAVLEGMADQIYLQGRLDEPGADSKADDGEDNLLQKYLGKVIDRREKAEYEASQIP